MSIVFEFAIIFYHLTDFLVLFFENDFSRENVELLVSVVFLLYQFIIIFYVLAFQWIINVSFSKPFFSITAIYYYHFYNI